MSTDPTDADAPDFGELSATYCPEDNKLRLTIGRRLPKEDYQALRDLLAPHGFKWAGKQEIFVAPRWTPAAEDLLYELCGDIEDEDYSPEERAADRAERFAGYQGRRLEAAEGSADRFDNGPSAFGHQNRARAERQARRHDRHRGRALSHWGKSEYWQRRTEGVIGHALYKSSPSVRRARILRLEAEQRKHKSWCDEYRQRFNAWSRVADMDGADIPLGDQDVTKDSPEAIKAAYILTGSGCYGTKYTHPRTGETKDLYDLIRRGSDPLTPREAATLWLADATQPDDPDASRNRWAAHYELRLTYENAMLANEGGKASEVEIEPGGWIYPSRRDIVFGRAHVAGDGSAQVLRVFKSPETGRVTSVQVMGDERYLNDNRTKPRTINIERLGDDCYRPPTDEERAAFVASQKEAKAAAKAAKPKEAPLINPTDEDAERLQALWNAEHRARYEAKYPPGKYHGLDYKPSEVLRMNQATYSANSKGEYARLETRTIDGNAKPSRRSSNLWTREGADYDKKLGETICKLRLGSSGNGWDSPPRVIILTDKPQKPIPFDWDSVANAEPATADASN